MVDIVACPIPEDSAINEFIAAGPVKFAGAIVSRLPEDVTITATDLARATFSRPVMAEVGEDPQNTSRINRMSKHWQRPVDPSQDGELTVGEKFGFWRVYGVRPHEVLVGNDDPLLSYRVAFRVAPDRTAVIASATRSRNVGGNLWWRLFGGQQQRLLRVAMANGIAIGSETARHGR
jgi:hypothetical protein